RPRGAGDRGHRLRPAGPVPAAARRAGRGHLAAGRCRGGHRERRQAPRRPPGRAHPGPRRPGHPAGPASARPGAAGGQAHVRRPGGNTRRAAGAGRRSAGREQDSPDGSCRTTGGATVLRRARRPPGAGPGGGRGRRGARRRAAQRRGEPARGAHRPAAGRGAGAPRRGSRGDRADRGRPGAAGPALGSPGRRRHARGGRDRGGSRFSQRALSGAGRIAMQVIATAGHVDHGKSTLVRALTGMEPDRWEAERRRGLSIDLGFAWLTLPSGERLAFVDVPGHERFVPNMLAGVGPVPAVMFVVAADEGWMPQSAEHLAAIDALAISRGLLVVTRADLTDPAPALREAAERIRGTSLGAVDALAVSGVTGQGLPELRAALDRLTARLPVSDPGAPVRLWVDRAFSIRGSGTVVTGTLPAGTIGAGDELLAAPSLRPARVRGIQALKEQAERVSGVARVALNLRGVAPAALARGTALVTPGAWALTAAVDVRLAVPAAAARPPRELVLHIGTARTTARVRVLGGAVARLALDRPLPLHVGDRVLL